MTELILIRHGETDMNRELRFQGQVDPPLNAIGHEQARRLGQRLAGAMAHGLYLSDLLRTRETAAPIASTLALPGVPDPALREQAFGAVDGLTVADIQARWPEAWSRWTAFDPLFAMPGGGESTHDFHARVMGAFARIAAAHAGQTLVVVTHGGVLDMVYRTAMGLGLNGPRQSEIPNAGLNRVRMAPAGRVEILDWADTRHLSDLPAQPTYDQKKVSADAA